MNDENEGAGGAATTEPGSASATIIPAATGNSTAGQGAAADKSETVTLTKSELDARDARVRKATEASIREKVKRDADASQMTAEQKATHLQTQLDAANAKADLAEHRASLSTVAARLGFTSSPYLKTALEDAIKAHPETVDYEAVARAAMAAAAADGLSPKTATTAATTPAANGTGADSSLTPNQNGAAAKQGDDALASMSEAEMLARARKDPEWRKKVLEPFLDRKGAALRQGHAR